jgi:Tol biopolymer transport system component
MRANQQGQTRLATWAPDSVQCGLTDILSSGMASSNWNYTASSSFMRWSPDGKRLLIEVNCQDDPWFYLGNLDGQFVKLINTPVLTISHLGDSFSWSPDGHSVIFTSDIDSNGNLDLYNLNVEAALKDPSTRPIRITTSGFDESSPDWQP